MYKRATPSDNDNTFDERTSISPLRKAAADVSRSSISPVRREIKEIEQSYASRSGNF